VEKKYGVFMDKKYLTSFLLSALAMFLMNCGSNPDLRSSEYSKQGIGSGPTGQARLIVKQSGSKSNEPYGSIKFFRAFITGDDIESPIIAEFDGSAENGIMDGIPVGSERSVKVEALSSRNQIIRKGISDNITITGGHTSEVEINLDAVPIFINLSDGNVVASTRLRFEVFSDPEDPLSISDSSSGSEEMLFDIATDSSEIISNLDTGLATLWPSLVIAGERTFTIRSGRTGYSSSVTLKVIDGNDIKPAPLFSAGSVYNSGNYISIKRMGSIYHAGIKSGILWPVMIEEVFE